MEVVKRGAPPTRYASNPTTGDRVSYAVFGRESDTAVLAQTGFGVLKECWLQHGYVEPILAAGFRLIVVDHLAHGESDRPSNPASYSVAMYCRNACAVLDAEGVNKAHYLGYSMGGIVGAALAERAPERFLSFTLGGCDPTLGTLPRFTKHAFVKRMFDPVIMRAMLKLSGEPAGQNDWVDNASGAHHAQCLENVFRGLYNGVSDCTAALNAVAASGAPVTLWLAHKDDFYPLSCVKGAAAANGWDFVEVRGDHLDALKAPDMSQPLIAGVLAQHKASSS